MKLSYFFILPVVVILISCAQEKEYLPGELAYDTALDSAEEIIQTASPQGRCDELKQFYDDGVEAFKLLMPSLSGLSSRKKDSRLNDVRLYIEDNC